MCFNLFLFRIMFVTSTRDSWHNLSPLNILHKRYMFTLIESVIVMQKQHKAILTRALWKALSQATTTQKVLQTKYNERLINVIRHKIRPHRTDSIATLIIKDDLSKPKRVTWRLNSLTSPLGRSSVNRWQWRCTWINKCLPAVWLRSNEIPLLLPCV